MSEPNQKLLEARIEAYKNLVGARTALALSGDTTQERQVQEAATELHSISIYSVQRVGQNRTMQMQSKKPSQLVQRARGLRGSVQPAKQ